MRGLLHVAAAAATAAAAEQQHGAEEHPHPDEQHAQSTLDLRIAAIFVIWIGAALFGLPTILHASFRSLDAAAPRLLRSFAGGIIVALALVHIIPEAVTELEGLVEFPVGGCTVLAGIMCLVLVDNALAALLAPEAYKAQIRASTAAAAAAADAATAAGSSGGGRGKAAAAAGGGDASTSSGGCAHGHGGGHSSHGGGHGGHGHAAHKPALAAVSSNSSGKDQHASLGPGDSAADLKDAGLAAAQSAAASHGHQCLRSLNATGWVSSAAAPMASVRQCVTAYTMELGCIFHSVIIGVSVGVVTSDRQLVVTLMVALAVHQGLEALALGSVLALTSFAPAKKAAMLLLYSITTPLGIAVGIALAASYDAESVASRAVQGSLNGVSGGMLLYIGMYQLIAEEFSREDLLVRPRLRLGMYAALLAGAAAMCVLGIWS